MARSSIFSPKFTPTPYQYPSIAISSMMSTKSLSSFSSPYVNCKRDFPIAKVASIPYEPVNQDYLEGEFSGHGVTFEGIGDSCIAKMELENGSIAKLMLPSGLITSYKAHMWHKGIVELLHTSVSEGVADDADDAVIQGGISLALSFESDDQASWSPSTWSLHQVRGRPAESIQIEMISNDPERKIKLKHVVTLEEDFLSSELIVSNSSSTSLRLLGGVISHLTVSSPDAIYVLGLEGSNFIDRKPILSEFVITPPDFGLENQPGYGQVYGKMSLGALMSTLGAKKQSNADETESSNTSASEEEEDIEGEEDDNYKQLTDEMCRIYTYAPRAFTVMDRGRRNSILVGRSGFEELYMMSPGSNHEFYSKFAYICVGQAAMLKPIIVEPGDEWRGGAFLHNPNLE
uniref:NDH-dependent cyclic electron flow 5 n=1 Tax=Pelargonium transvaalense TaxID=158603 RepID=A0A0F7GYM7_9ROSI